MAVIPIIGNVTVSGALKEISGGYANIDGVWKELVKTYVNIDGIWKDTRQILYTWGKYSVNTVTTYKEHIGKRSTFSLDSSRRMTTYSSYTFNNSTGTYALTGTSYYESADEIAKAIRTYPYTKRSGIFMRLTSGQELADESVQFYYQPLTAIAVETQTQGDFIEYVTSDDETAYPENGIHTDGYWYVKMVDTPATKTFTISGDIDTITCEFEEGMTWEDWVNSDYAVNEEKWNAGKRGTGYDGYFYMEGDVDVGYVYMDDEGSWINHFLYYNDMSLLTIDDLIEADEEYTMMWIPND